ncbi:multicopper oxidase family protein [Pseudomaricurvus alcaniphilus]|uniref:multicopper oxidase domain-containing protein n=1 Tax=Pseudomaricurvus alcaniphilus TaxID=1166482 RepID=UPI00140B88C5|nr:multicopper oxidase family protein [Pseudomaricurvus alcaniphilus]
MPITRRQFLATAIAGVAVTTLPHCTLVDSDTDDYDYVLLAEPAPVEILPGTSTPAFTYNGMAPAPLLRVRQGQRLRVKFINRLGQPSTIHWHGIRIDNAMDGVPFLTQPPVQHGESFVYDFLCPDAGSFWYHPHVNSLEQMSRGLVGALIVEEAEPAGFDQDLVVVLKDWLLNADGSFKPFSSPRQAARMGTLGNVKTVNGLQKPVFEVPAGGLVRLRLINVDNTRVFDLSLKDYPAQVLALDGNAIAKPYPLDSRPTGAGMRLDLGLVAPAAVGEEVVVYDRKGRFNFEIFRLRSVPAELPRRTRIPALPVNPIPAPQLAEAEVLNFVFEWEGALTPANSDGKVDHKFWMINKRAWGHMSADHIPAPLAELSLGKTYIFELHNASPHEHPIHLHGYTFTVIGSDKREITPYHTDTILLAKNERARIAFVADNPGDWMYHCHVIEHMKTGLMGYIRVS